MNDHKSIHAVGQSHREPRARSHAKAKITVQSSEAKPYDQTVGPTLMEIHLTEAFTGDIDGESPVRALQVLRDNKSANLVACRSEFVTADAAGGIRVFPLDGPSIGGVGIDVAAEFASQVGNRGEDAPCDDLAFDLGEPDFDLIEPGRVSGREVKPDSRMLLEKLADHLSFVRGEIVEDDVNLLPRRA